MTPDEMSDHIIKTTEEKIKEISEAKDQLVYESQILAPFHDIGMELELKMISVVSGHVEASYKRENITVVVSVLGEFFRVFLYVKNTQKNRTFPINDYGIEQTKIEVLFAMGKISYDNYYAFQMNNMQRNGIPIAI